MDEKLIYKNFWTYLDILIEANGITFKDLCDKLELGYGSLRSTRSKGQIPNNIYVLIQIAEFFDVTVDYLLTGLKNDYPRDVQKVAVQLAQLDSEQRKPVITLVEGQINFWKEAFKK